MTETSPATTPRMPGIGRLLAAQITYQSRLLASGRAITIGVILPVLLLVSSHAEHTQITPADVAQYAVFGLSLTAWNTYGVRLVAAREAGILKRWRATPLPRWCYFAGRILATVVVATLAGAATVAAGILLYHTHLTLAAAVSTLLVFVLGAFAWAATATAVTAAIPTIEAAAPTMLLIYFPTVIISGALGSINEPHWLTTLATYLPAQPLVHAAGITLGYTPGLGSWPAHDIIVLAAWAIVGMTVALATFRWEPRRPTPRRPARPPRPLSPVSTRPADPNSNNTATAAVQFRSTMPSRV